MKVHKQWISTEGAISYLRLVAVSLVASGLLLTATSRFEAGYLIQS